MGKRSRVRVVGQGEDVRCVFPKMRPAGGRCFWEDGIQRRGWWVGIFQSSSCSASVIRKRKDGKRRFYWGRWKCGTALWPAVWDGGGLQWQWKSWGNDILSSWQSGWFGWVKEKIPSSLVAGFFGGGFCGDGKGRHTDSAERTDGHPFPPIGNIMGMCMSPAGFYGETFFLPWGVVVGDFGKADFCRPVFGGVKRFGRMESRGGDDGWGGISWSFGCGMLFSETCFNVSEKRCFSAEGDSDGLAWKTLWFFLVQRFRPSCFCGCVFRVVAGKSG